MISVLPAERALSTTFCISQGERNWPFLIFTGLPCEDTAMMKLVCRHRNAGVCRTSTTAATSPSGVSSCTSVSTGTPICSRTCARALRPAAMPGPRKLRREDRLALSNDALKMKGMPSAAVISFRRPATSMTNPALSITQGPAIKKNGHSCPTSKEANFMCTARRPDPRTSRGCAARLQRSAILACGAHEAGEQRVPIARRRGEFRVELTGDEPRMRAQFDEFHQSIGGEAREGEAGRAHLVEIVIVEFVAVAVALEYRLSAVQCARQGTWNQFRFLGAEPHAAAEFGLFIAYLLTALQILPLGDQGDYRVIRGPIELRTVGAFEGQHVARIFDDGELHTQTNAKIGNAVFARKADRLNLSFDAAIAETARHQNGVHFLQRRCARALDILRFEIMDVDPGAGLDAGVHQSLVEGNIRVANLHVLADHADVHDGFRVLLGGDDRAPLGEVGGRSVQAQLVDDDVVQI